MGVSENKGTPKWMVYSGKPFLKWMIWGKTHYFRKHPYGGTHKMQKPLSVLENEEGFRPPM